MKLWIQFPTRNRPERFWEYFQKYQEYLYKPEECLINVVIDADDASMNNDDMMDRILAFKNVRLTIDDDENRTKHKAVNSSISKSLPWDVLLLASDDMLPMERGYDNVIKTDMEKFFPDTDGALWYFDGNRRDINTLQIMGRKYYERFGYIYREETIAFYGDTEFQEVAESLKKLQYIDRCIIRHEHYEWNREIKKDETYSKNSPFFEHDRLIFEERKAKGFPR
jgi:hypothetical protein